MLVARSLSGRERMYVAVLPLRTREMVFMVLFFFGCVSFLACFVLFACLLACGGGAVFGFRRVSMMTWNDASRFSRHVML